MAPRGPSILAFHESHYGTAYSFFGLVVSPLQLDVAHPAFLAAAAACVCPWVLIAIDLRRQRSARFTRPFASSSTGSGRPPNR